MNRIRELRQQRNWRQEDLAQKMNTKRQTVARYETEKLGIDANTICALCDIFGCTADYLLCRSDNPRPVIPDEKAALLDAYDRATPEVQRTINFMLEPYRKGSTMSSTA